MADQGEGDEHLADGGAVDALALEADNVTEIDSITGEEIKDFFRVKLGEAFDSGPGLAEVGEGGFDFDVTEMFHMEIGGIAPFVR